MKATHAKLQKLVFADQAISEAVFALLASERSLGDYIFASKSEDIHEDIYFDTPTRGLQQTRASLRLRRMPDGTGALQFKKPSGDVAVDMGYVTLECGHGWSEAAESVETDTGIRTAMLLQAEATDVTRVGSVKTTRRMLRVADHRPCALFEDRFTEVTQVCVSVNAEAFTRDFLGCLARRQTSNANL